MDDKNYQLDDYYSNDESNSSYYGNDNYNPNYNYYNNMENYPYNNPKPKKGMGIISGLAIGLLSVASLTGIGIGVYYLVTQSSTNKNSSNNSGSTNSADLSETGEYISQRTLTLQFVLDNDDGSGTCTVSSGTGWIINKDKNDDIYYVATNLHVAAALTYANNNVWNYEQNSETQYGDLLQSLVGYSTNYNYQNNTYTLNMITVPEPTIVYTTAMDSNWSALGYGQATGEAYEPASNSYTYTTYQYDMESDFAILKYDFRNASLSGNSITAAINPNKSSEIDTFESWLNTYDSNPTMFLTDSIQNYSNLKFSMGGYPAASNDDSNNSANDADDNDAISLYQNDNYSGAEWKEFIDFTGNPYSSSYGIGTASSVQATSKIKSSTPIVYVDKTNITPNSTNPWDGGYVNGAYGYQLGESSQPGSSGSMLVTQINDKYYVVGIYWGETTANNIFTYGAADIFNTNQNGTYSGYNLIEWSYNYLTNNGASLYFNPTTNQKN